MTGTATFFIRKYTVFVTAGFTGLPYRLRHRLDYLMYQYSVTLDKTMLQEWFLHLLLNLLVVLPTHQIDRGYARLDRCATEKGPLPASGWFSAHLAQRGYAPAHAHTRARTHTHITTVTLCVRTRARVYAPPRFFFKLQSLRSNTWRTTRILSYHCGAFCTRRRA